MACEKRLNKEIDELRQHIKKMQETERKERKKLAEEDALRKIKKLEENIQDLQKNLATQKQVRCYNLFDLRVRGYSPSGCNLPMCQLLCSVLFALFACDENADFSPVAMLVRWTDFRDMTLLLKIVKKSI